MKLLLDTQILLWAALKPTRLSKRASAAIGSVPNTIYLSAATAWEVATKTRIGKLPEGEELERDLLDAAIRAGYTWLPISEEVALRAGRLVGSHKDPFDRMIAAQALELDLALVSSDAKLDQFGVRRIW